MWLLAQANNSDLTLDNLWYKIIVTIFIGILIGIERERNKTEEDKPFAGIRTFPLISMLGFLSAFLAEETSIVVFIASLVSFGLLVSLSYYFSANKGDMGGTSEVTFLLVFILGALVFYDHLLISTAITVVVMIFLYFKPEFHKFVGKLENEDFYAAIKFAIITIIILPLLPNKTYGPFDVINPRNIWYMVVLISGISFVGYVLFKLIGTKRGVQVLALLGGLVSSTAVTLSFTARSKEMEPLSRNLSAGIVLASSIMFPRVVLVIAVINTQLAYSLILPFSILFVLGVGVSLLMWKNPNKDEMENIKLTNPFRISFALKFGLIFGAILFISAAAQHYLGDQGMYLTSFLAGFMDVDAVALSAADLINDKLSVDVATAAVVIAAASNSIVKAVIAAFFGAKQMRKYALAGFSVIVIASVLYVGYIMVF